MSNPIIEVFNLGKRYRLGQVGAGSLREELEDLFHRRSRTRAPESRRGDFWALRGVSFTVERGEVLGVVGRNGAGKSTLLKLLSRITEPTEGKAILRGRVASLLEVGTGFHPELSGRENIFLNGTVLGMTRTEITRKFDEIVEFAGVETFLDTPVKRYSSGMRVRLGFAVAAHLEPEILIVDEVLAVGDAAFQRKCLGKMKEVSQGGRTVLFVSHNLPMVQALCDRGILLEGGQLCLEGSAMEVTQKYLRPGGKLAGSGRQELSSWSRGGGKTKGIFTEAWAEDSEGTIAETFFMGEAVSIVVSVHSERPILRPRIGCRIENENGQPVVSADNMTMPGDQPESISTGTIRFCFDQLQLLSGQYYVSFWLLEDKRTKLDSPERCLSFTVNPADVFKTGHAPPTGSAICYLNGRVRIEISSS